MNCKGTTIQLIINGFIDLPADKIERLYQDDSTFREICEDYAECIQMRDRYANDATDRDAPKYRQDYEELIEALGEELLAIYQGNKQLLQVESSKKRFIPSPTPARYPRYR